MIGKKVARERTVPLVRVKEILERRKKEGEELEYGQRLTYDYSQKFTKIDPKKADELMGKLLEAGLKEHQAVAIMDFMPEKKEDFDLIFSKERTKPSEEEIKKVLEILDGYRK
ncbi:MAG: RNA polymerase Rpb4 family protein [Candidatus Hadarchaeales archaeon]